MKAKIGTSGMPDEQVLALVKSVIASGEGKAELETTAPKLSQIETLVGECDDAFETEGVAQDTFLTARIERINKVTKLRSDFGEFTQSVDALYHGDIAKLQAIGLGVRGSSSPVGPLPAPENVRSRSGPSEGTAYILWGSVRGRYVYELEYAPSADGPWKRCYHGTALRHVCEGLTPGAEYWFRVCAVGKAGPSPWSQVIRRRAS